MKNVDEMVKKNVNKALDKERKIHTKIKIDLDNANKKLEKLDQEKKEFEDMNYTLQERVKNLTDDLDVYLRNEGDREHHRVIDKVRADKEKLEIEISKLNKDLTLMATDLEDVMAENRVLRTMHDIPDNFGIQE